jgi:plasmid maintenance system antidote protein VapI
MRMASLAIAAIILTGAWQYPVKAEAAAQSMPSQSSKPAGAPGGNAQPLGRDATIDQFNTVLSNDCGTVSSTGHQISLAWQQQIQASGPAKIVQSLLDFRQNAAMCLERIGDLINSASPAAADVAASISGSWGFSAELWISTNQFAKALSDNSKETSAQSKETSAQIVTAALPQSQAFAASVDKFTKWVADTQAQLANLRRQSSSG